jgi:outer membrane protein assembly factor BamA
MLGATPGRRPPLHASLLFCFALLVCASARAEDVIREIRFVGNETTRERVMLQEMTIKVGDPTDPLKIEQSRQAIMNLGLFKKVDAQVLRAADGGRIVQITVEEKYYVLPLPRFNRNADGDISYGAQLRWDNLAGLNQTLHLTYSIGRPADSQNETRNLSLNYSYPRIGGGPYNLDAGAGNLRENIFATTPDGLSSRYVHDGRSTNFVVSRYLDAAGPSRGWRVGGGMSWSEDMYRDATAVPAPNDSHSTSLVGLVDYTDVQDYLYSRMGESYGYTLQWAPVAINRHNDYTVHRFFWRYYRPIGDTPYQNIDTQVQLGMSTSYEGNAFALGGADTLRGYPKNSIAGKAFWLVNVEYLRPIGDRAVRGVLFFDAGNAYPSNGSINLRDVKMGVGIGLRIRLKSFVRIQLRLDYAYGIDFHKQKVYGGTQDTF